MGRLETPVAATRTFPRERRQAAQLDRVPAGTPRSRCPHVGRLETPVAATRTFPRERRQAAQLDRVPAGTSRQLRDGRAAATTSCRGLPRKREPPLLAPVVTASRDHWARQ